MNREFEEFDDHLEDLEDELGEFEEDLDDLDEEFEGEFPLVSALEFTDVKVRTAVLKKNELIALLCLKTADQGGAICRVDPREASPSVQIYDDPSKAEEWFTKSLSTSLKNGWNVVYDGLPLEG